MVFEFDIRQNTANNNNYISSFCMRKIEILRPCGHFIKLLKIIKIYISLKHVVYAISFRCLHGCNGIYYYLHTIQQVLPAQFISTFFF